MGRAQETIRLSAKAYLEWEAETDERHEFYDGRVVAMAGGTLEHDAIGTNVRGTLFGMLRGKPCKVFFSDLKIFIDAANAYVYSDGMVICGPPAHPSNNRDRVSNPVWIMEVLSDATEQNDRGSKFAKYQSLPSFREYVLISQHEPAVEVFFRQENQIWQYSRYTQAEQIIPFRSIDCEMKLSDIYEGISFPDPAAS